MEEGAISIRMLGCMYITIYGFFSCAVETLGDTVENIYWILHFCFPVLNKGSLCYEWDLYLKM